MQFLKILLLVMFIGIAGCESREEARRKQAANFLKQVRLANQAYESSYKPPAGKKPSYGSEHAPKNPTAKTQELEGRAREMKKVSGEVAGFQRSPSGNLDGITLKDGTEIWFSPKANKKVAATILIGDQVELSGWTHAGEFELHAATITNVGSGKAVDANEPPPDSQE